MILNEKNCFKIAIRTISIENINNDNLKILIQCEMNSCNSHLRIVNITVNMTVFHLPRALDFYFILSTLSEHGVDMCLT